MRALVTYLPTYSTDARIFGSDEVTLSTTMSYHIHIEAFESFLHAIH